MSVPSDPFEITGPVERLTELPPPTLSVGLTYRVRVPRPPVAVGDPVEIHRSDGERYTVQVTVVANDGTVTIPLIR